MLLISMVNMPEFFLRKTKKVSQLVMIFKIFQMSLTANQTQYGYMKVANFTIYQ